MNLEFLLRRNKDWRTELRGILFTEGDIVKRAETAGKESRLNTRLDRAGRSTTWPRSIACHCTERQERTWCCPPVGHVDAKWLTLY